MVAHVAVDAATGTVRVRRITVAHDCGLIINPDGVRNQIEGNVLQALSRALKEEVHFDGRGRAGDGDGGGGDRQRDLRGNGGAAASGAVHAGSGARGAGDLTSFDLITSQPPSLPQGRGTMEV